jgi:hypothetical protein
MYLEASPHIQIYESEKNDHEYRVEYEREIAHLRQKRCARQQGKCDYRNLEVAPRYFQFCVTRRYRAWFCIIGVDHI